MPLYIVSYDLLGEPSIEAYEPLIRELQRLGAQEILRSEWALRASNTSVEIRDHFRQYLRPGDRILVTEITANWASLNALTDLNKV